MFLAWFSCLHVFDHISIVKKTILKNYSIMFMTLRGTIPKLTSGDEIVCVGQAFTNDAHVRFLWKHTGTHMRFGTPIARPDRLPRQWKYMYHRLLVYTCSPIIFVTYARLILIVAYTAMTIMTEGISLRAVTFMVREVESTSDVNRGLEPYQSSTALTFPVLYLRYQAWLVSQIACTWCIAVDLTMRYMAPAGITGLGPGTLEKTE